MNKDLTKYQIHSAGGLSHILNIYGICMDDAMVRYGRRVKKDLKVLKRWPGITSYSGHGKNRKISYANPTVDFMAGDTPLQISAVGKLTNLDTNFDTK